MYKIKLIMYNYRNLEYNYKEVQGNSLQLHICIYRLYNI